MTIQHGTYYQDGTRWVRFVSCKEKTGSYFSNWSIEWNVEEYLSEKVTQPNTRGNDTGNTQTATSETAYPKDGQKGENWYYYDGIK